MGDLFQQILEASNYQVWTTDIVPTANGKHIRFYHPIHIKLNKLPNNRYLCVIGSYVTESADDLLLAYYKAATALWNLIAKLIGTPTHRLSEEEVMIKGQLITAVDLLDTAIIPHQTSRHIPCRLEERDSHFYAIPYHSDHEHLRLEIPEHCLADIQATKECVFMAQVECSRDGYPESVISLEILSEGSTSSASHDTTPV
jgi:hypothetical protein